MNWTNKIKLIFILSITNLVFYSCYNNIERTRYSNKKSFSEVKRYTSKYGYLKSSKVDTVIFYKKIKCIYTNGVLSEIGSIRKGQKYGRWYTFSKELRLLSARTFENDSTSNILYLINPY